MADFGGLNPTHAVAGFGGGLAYLPFMNPANRWAVLGAVVAGIATAAFVTPLVADILRSTLHWNISEKAEHGLAFLLGLTSMSLIPAVLGAVEWVKHNISRIMERITGVSHKSQEGEDGKP